MLTIAEAGIDQFMTSTCRKKRYACKILIKTQNVTCYIHTHMYISIQHVHTYVRMYKMIRNSYKRSKRKYACSMFVKVRESKITVVAQQFTGGRGNPSLESLQHIHIQYLTQFVTLDVRF